MLGIQPADTSMLTGVWSYCTGVIVWGGGISSGTLHWLDMTSTSRYSKSEQYLKWKSMEKEVLFPNLMGGLPPTRGHYSVTNGKRE